MLTDRKQPRAALRPGEFADAIGVCRATVYKMMHDGKLRTVKNGKGHRAARFILTTPAEFMAGLEEDDEL